MKPEGFPRRLRLRRRREFLRVQRGGRKHHTRFFLVFVAPRKPERQRVDARPTRPHEMVAAAVAAVGGELPDTRLGVTVTRKVGNAVKRNRIKRLVREAFRKERRTLPGGFDMVWVAKRDATETTLEVVEKDMRWMAARLLREGQPEARRQ